MTDPKDHRHLRRLSTVFARVPIYFITTCVANRRPLLGNAEIAEILIEEWRAAWGRHRWAVGRYVIMPDHAHFFCRPHPDAVGLSSFMRSWKSWSAKRVLRTLGRPAPLWQPEFFDHLLRSEPSYFEKWEYVRLNPVRAGLADEVGDWPWQGFIHELEWCE